MSRYDLFSAHLRKLGDINSRRFTFKEIEDIILETLPNSAYHHLAWWSNSHSHPLMREALGVGWKTVKVDLKLREVQFERQGKKVTEPTIKTHEQGSVFQQELGWSSFEINARQAIEKELGIQLGSKGIEINGKIKRFDLVNEKEMVVGDIKQYRTTRGGNRPSAKFSILNEYVWLMQLLDTFTGQRWRKLLVVGEDLEMVRRYVAEFNRWLDEVEIYFFSTTSDLKKIR